MKAIAAHFKYISKNGRLDIEDELGNAERGKNAVRDVAEDWRFGGSFIGETSDRREAFNIMLSMPHGTDSLTVLRAAREFAQIQLADHKYVLVLHDHQANPHTSAFGPSPSTASGSIPERPICSAGGNSSLRR